MAFKTYLATYNAAGLVESLTEIPQPEQERKRTLLVRAKSEAQAEKVAKDLFSMAK